MFSSQPLNVNLTDILPELRNEVYSYCKPEGPEKV